MSILARGLVLDPGVPSELRLPEAPPSPAEISALPPQTSPL